MASRFPVYESQERVRSNNPQEIVLPQMGDPGDAFRSLVGTALQVAEPWARKEAEDQAAADAGAAKIVKDDMGRYVRSNVTRGGGLVYLQAYGDALDQREANLRDMDFESELSKLSIKFGRDVAGFTEAATGLAEGALSTVPPKMRGLFENRWGRSLMERTRYKGERAAEETHDSLVRGNGQLIEEAGDRIAQIVAAVGDDGVPGPDTEKLIDDEVARASAAAETLKGLGVSDVELEARGMRLAAKLFDPVRRLEAIQALRLAGPVLANANDEESLARIILWSDGIEGEPGAKVNGLDYETYRRTYGPASSTIGRFARDKLNRLEQKARDEAAASQPMTSSEYLAELGAETNVSGTGVSYDRDSYAGIQKAFRDQTGKPIGELIATPEGRSQVVGLLRTKGVLPVNAETTMKAVLNWGNGGHATDAAKLLYGIRDSKYGNRSFERIVTGNRDAMGLLSWVEDMQFAGMAEGTINTMWQDKMSGLIKPFKREDFAHWKGGYEGQRDLMMAGHLGLEPNDPQIAMTRDLWDDPFDKLLELNLHLYNNQEKAMNRTAAQISRMVSRSPYFVGGVGDRRVFDYGPNPKVLDEVFRRLPLPPHVRKAIEAVSWSDVQDNGDPRIVMRKAETGTYGDALGDYRFTIFTPDGRATSFVYSMDEIEKEHDIINNRIAAAERARQKAEAVPDKWLLKAGKWVYNPAYDAFLKRKGVEGRAASRKAADAQERRFRYGYEN